MSGSCVRACVWGSTSCQHVNTYRINCDVTLQSEFIWSTIRLLFSVHSAQCTSTRYSWHGVFAAAMRALRTAVSLYAAVSPCVLAQMNCLWNVLSIQSPKGRALHNSWSLDKIGYGYTELDTTCRDWSTAASQIVQRIEVLDGCPHQGPRLYSSKRSLRQAQIFYSNGNPPAHSGLNGMWHYMSVFRLEPPYYNWEDPAYNPKSRHIDNVEDACGRFISMPPSARA